MLKFIGKVGSNAMKFNTSNNRKGHRNIGEYLKSKGQQQNNAASKYQDSPMYNVSNAPKLLLYSQFLPAAFIAIPVLFYIGDPLSL